MSHSVFDPSMDSVAQWIDTSLISDPDLIHLMESYNSMPFDEFDIGSSSTPVQDLGINTDPAAANNFELPHGFGDGYTLSELARKPSIVRSEATSWSQSTLERAAQGQEMPFLEEAAKVKKERRRAQNRKAQQAFRQRKDTAIARLEREMERLKSINQDLCERNNARLQEISELKARLAALRLAPLSLPSEGQGTGEAKKAEMSPSSRVSTPADEPTNAATVPWIKWRGRLYIDNEALALSSKEHCGSSSVGRSIGPVQTGDEFRM